MKQITASSLKALIRLDIRSRFGTRKDISKKELINSFRLSWTQCCLQSDLASKLLNNLF